MTLTEQQVTQLLQPINPSRVLADGKGHAHVSQQDILAHLIRVFGFGNFDTEVLSLEPIFEQPAVKNDKRFDVCYRALVRLTIRDPDGNTVAHYENGSTATAQNQTRGDGHDLAMKSAISLAVKRAAIALGDQFGLSLYNKGQRDALVRGTIVGAPAVTNVSHVDVQEGVPQQLAMGHDEVDRDLGDDGPPTHAEPVPSVSIPAGPPTLPTTNEPPPDETSPKPKKKATAKQVQRIGMLATDMGLDRDQKLAGVGVTIGREVETTKSLTPEEASTVIDAMQASLDSRVAK